MNNPINSDPSAQDSARKKARVAARRRAIVMSIVTLGLLVAVVFAVSWLWYRYEHTVIAHASVKGRLHRIGARIDGQVTAIEVIPGQRVRKGEVLIRLEDAHFQATVRQKDSELTAGIKRYDAEKLGIDHERRRLTLEVERCETQIGVVSGDLQAAQSTQERFEREFERIGMLSASGVASDTESDRIKSDRDNARARVRSAQAAFSVAEVNCRAAHVALEGLAVREAGLAVMAAEIERSRQQLSAAQADIAATVIRAPEDGWVADRLIETGGSAKVGEPILLVWMGDPWIEAWADEKQLKTIVMGSSADVSLRAFPDRKLQGRVEGIGVLTDKELQPTTVPSTLFSLFPRTAKVPIRVAVNARHLRLQPGLTAVVGIRDAEQNREGAKAVTGFIAPTVGSTITISSTK